VSKEKCVEEPSDSCPKRSENCAQFGQRHHVIFPESAKMKEIRTLAQCEDRLGNHKARYFIERILSEHDFRGRMLEIGAGSCWASTLIKKESPSTTVIASDISTRNMKIGMKTGHDQGLGADFSVACDAEKLPFQDDAFDLVLGNAVLHHLSNVQEAISEIHRVLKTRGKYFGSGEPIGGVFFKKIWRNRFLAKVIRRNTAEETLFTFEEFKNNFNSCGFGELRIEQETSWQHKVSNCHAAQPYRLVSRVPDFIINFFLLIEIGVVATKG
jgi:ubiquinone/menaquinone biosynthesis C-methylase UbiE